MNGNTSLSRTGGGKVLILLLLFALALFNFKSAGITGLMLVCMVPLVVLLIMLTLRYKMFLFTVLMVVNYYIMFLAREGFLFLPISLHTEVIELALITVAIIDAREGKGENIYNMLLFTLIVWCVFCTIEILNDACGIGINAYAWYTGARLMAFQLLYAFIVCAVYINSPKRVLFFTLLWCGMALFAVFWIWKQQYVGLTSAEKFYVLTNRPAIVNGRIRYFATFSDGASCGCHMACAAIAFLAIAISNKINYLRVIFAIAGLLCVWAFFCTGTRTAIICFIFGMGIYIVLSKNIRIFLPIAIVMGLFVCFLAFTNIGQGNYNIRRMRSAFRSDDASLNVRDINKAALAKYMVDVPWGIGIGIEQGDVPPYNKFKVVTEIPPDSEYVYIWVRTGVVGISLFVTLTVIMFLGACYVVFFRIRNPSLRGIGAAYTCAFAAIQLGGYANQILMQFPNVLIFYGGLTIVYLLPNIDDEYTAYEASLIEKDAAARAWVKRLVKKYKPTL